MSECRYILNGPPIDWTIDHIREHNVKLGLIEIPVLRQELRDELLRQVKAGFQYGFYKERISWMNRLQEQLDGPTIQFKNPNCHLCTCDSCLLIWKTENGYKTDQCNSAFYSSKE
jgi:hypothetical protein